MKRITVVLLFVLAMTAVGLAQNPQPAVQVFSSATPVERGLTRLLYWDNTKNAAVGQLSISYGQPMWKKEYENQATFDGFTKGKVWRFGKDFWTTLDTGLVLKAGGRSIPAGYYYLGLDRTEVGDVWSVVLVDPVEARKAGYDASDVGKLKVAHRIPVKAEKAAAMTEKLTVLLTASKENPKEVTLRISWGTMNLTGSIGVGAEF